MSFENPRIKVTGVVFQNKHGSKYYSNYFLSAKEARSDFDLTKEEYQRKFEHGLRAKSQRLSSTDQTQIFTLESYTVLFKLVDELQVFLVVPDDENFILMEQVINTITQVLHLITSSAYTGKVIFDYLQDIVLVVDEIIHQGYIICMEPNKVFDRLRMKDSLGSDSPQKPQKPQPQQQSFSSQPQPAQGGTFSNLFGFAKNTFGKTLNLG